MPDISDKIITSFGNCAVGVSGGRDSMALCHMLHAAGIKFTALTVDHALRPESRSEAENVGKILAQWGITHHILTWAGNKPSTGIMDAAREARYALLTEYCKDNAINILVTAHQADDRIETFLYRLTRGSGPDGLSGIAETSVINGITLIRPLLNMTRAEVTEYCKTNNVPYIDDPSNENGHYTRVRFRKFLESEGLDGNMLNRTISRISRATEALDIIADDAYTACVKSDNNDTAVFNAEDWKYFHPEIRIRVLQRIIRNVTGDFFAVRLSKVEKGAEMLQELEHGKSYTLGGVMFTRRNNEVKAVREARRD